MREALALARRAARSGEVPIGAVVVRAGEIIGEGFNLRETTGDPTTHAEVIAIREAAGGIGDWRLEDCTLYVTCEPCLMCSGAILWSRIPRVVYGCADPKAGAVRSLYRVLEDDRLNHQVEVTSGVLGDTCAELLKSFFRELRSR